MHETLGRSPAMTVEISQTLWSMENIGALIDAGRWCESTWGLKAARFEKSKLKLIYYRWKIGVTLMRTMSKVSHAAL